MVNSSLPVTGGNVNTWTRSNGDHAEGIVIENAGTDDTAVVNALGEQLVALRAAPLAVSTLGTAGGAVTVTLPAVAARYHFLASIEVWCFTTAARTASATSYASITTTNLGGLAFSISGGYTVGAESQRFFPFYVPQQSTTINAASTIVAPGTTGLLWRITARYYAGV